MDDETIQGTWVFLFIPTYRSVIQYRKSTHDTYLLGLFVVYYARFRCSLGMPENSSHLNSVCAWKWQAIVRSYKTLQYTLSIPPTFPQQEMKTLQRLQLLIHYLMFDTVTTRKAPIHIQHASDTPPQKTIALFQSHPPQNQCWRMFPLHRPLILGYRYMREQSECCLTPSLSVTMSLYDGILIASVFDEVEMRDIVKLLQDYDISVGQSIVNEREYFYYFI
ncbi:hypothetical protein F5146DRAFT_1002592 [Armillaria mellea]|nr:hypothetical protein F5146DRAFT_1002592 [Armillaria mellea]